MPRRSTAKQPDLPLWKLQAYDNLVLTYRAQSEAIRRVLPLLRGIQDLKAQEALGLLTSQWTVEHSMAHLSRLIEEIIALAERLEALFPGSISKDKELVALLDEMRAELDRERSQAESLGH